MCAARFTANKTTKLMKSHKFDVKCAIGCSIKGEVVNRNSKKNIHEIKQIALQQFDISKKTINNEH